MYIMYMLLYCISLVYIDILHRVQHKDPNIRTTTTATTTKTTTAAPRKTHVQSRTAANPTKTKSKQTGAWVHVLRVYSL